MSKLATVIYIVGPKRSWEFQAKHVKRVFLFVLLIFLGLGGTILFQQYNHLQQLAKSDEKFDQEKLKNEKKYFFRLPSFCSEIDHSQFLSKRIPRILRLF